MSCSIMTISRRGFLGALTGAAVLVGFDPVRRVWISEAEAACGLWPLAQVPPLDGTLSRDLASRNASSNDKGMIVTQLPAAVLRPGSVEDIRKMVQFCRTHGIRVAARGQHHTMHGQSLSCGLVVEMSALSTIHSITQGEADVDAGVTWDVLLDTAFASGQRPITTGYTRLSVGGTFSVGGCPLSNTRGALVDNARELTVVTGRAETITCSESSPHADLFDAALGGLGQCGIIARAKVNLVPALPKARTYLLHYLDTAQFFADFKTLVHRGECDEIYNVCMPPGSNTFVYQINAVKFFDPAAPPDDAFLMRGMSVLPVSTDQSFLDYAHFVDRQIDVLQLAGWDQLVKPWFDVWLPEQTVEQYVGDVVENLTLEDVGPTGFVLIFAQKRSQLRRPFLRVPDNTDYVYLFDICTTSALPGPNPLYASRMVQRNRELYTYARAQGATRYPIGVLDFSQADWIDHYGPAWNAFRTRKQKYDPDTILTPGPGIFPA